MSVLRIRTLVTPAFESGGQRTSVFPLIVSVSQWLSFSNHRGTETVRKRVGEGGPDSRLRRNGVEDSAGGGAVNHIR